ncbi:MAG: NUDIX hydrolase [Blastocatellia bacterium]|jgi:ADP-ribose pyrophosphatase|nr:NUDIX hydrolase [Blastocatellia bacterium]
MTRIRQTGSREIYLGKVFDLTVDRFVDDDVDDREYEIEVVHHSGGAAILPLDANGDVVLVRQWRYALGRTLLEAPAGRIENGDDPATTARRELEEEAGYSAGTVESLGSILVAPGYTTERIHIFLATDLTPVPPRPDEDERIEVVRMPFDEAIARIDAGEIDDAKTIVALLRTAARRR